MSKSGQREDEELWLPVATPDNDELRSSPPIKSDRSVFVDQRDEAAVEWPHYIPPGGTRQFRLRWQYAAANLRDWLVRCLQAERAAGTGFLFLPVLLGLGILLYMALPREPHPIAFGALACVSLGWAAWSRAGIRRSLLLVLGVIAAGAAVGQIRTALVGTTMLSDPVTMMLTGTVTKVEQRADGRVRYTIAPDPETEARKWPKPFVGKVRVSARAPAEQVSTGMRISGRARLAAPAGAAHPGGYSFAFQFWFDGIAATGFFYGAPRIVSHGDDAWRINGVRESVGQHISEALPDRAGALARALIVGDRSGIDDETAEALRQSGLAHILAISGLHMALLAATVIVALRFCFAAAGGVVLRRSVRKWAALTALAFATVYLAVSGTSIATQRAWIMIAIMLSAVLIDRRALTLRNVAIAAMVVLVLSPEALMLPGFQMSFAAVMALVAAYDVLTRRMRESGLNERVGALHPLARRLLMGGGGLIATSLIAGTATAVFAAWHFHRIALYGLLANALAMPIVSVVVMPAGLASAIAMPFGLEWIPLMAMGRGIDAVVAIAHWVAGLGSSAGTGQLSSTGVLLISAGMIWLCILKTKLRLVALVPLLAGFALLPATQRPTLLISETGRLVAHLENDSMSVSRPRAEGFTRDLWQRAFPGRTKGLEVVNGSRAVTGPFQCDRFGCSARVDGVTVAHIFGEDVKASDCRLADIIVTTRGEEDACETVDAATLVVTPNLLKAHGALAVSFTKPAQADADRGYRSNSVQTMDKSGSAPNSIETNFSTARLHDTLQRGPTSVSLKSGVLARIEPSIQRANRPWNNHRRVLFKPPERLETITPSPGDQSFEDPEG